LWIDVGVGAYYTFDEDFDEDNVDIVVDSSGNNNHGKLISGEEPPYLDSGCIGGKCLVFDELVIVDLGSRPGLFPVSDITIDFWLKLDELPSVEASIVYFTSLNKEIIYMRLNSDNEVEFYVKGLEGGKVVVSAGTSLVADTWYNLIGERSGDIIKLTVKDQGDVENEFEDSVEGDAIEYWTQIRWMVIASTPTIPAVKGVIDEFKIINLEKRPCDDVAVEGDFKTDTNCMGQSCDTFSFVPIISCYCDTSERPHPCWSPTT
jgi:hypothetical protein